MLRKLWPRERVSSAGAQFDAFLDRRQRNDVAALAHTHQQAIDDSECQWQAQRDFGALAGLAGNVDTAAQGVDRAAHHVHANATPGHTGHFAGGGEAGLQDKLEQFAVGQPRTGRDQSLLFGALLDARAVQASAVVGDADQHLVPEMPGGQHNAALARLADSLAPCRQFHPVVRRIADQVDQRVGQAFDQRLVELGLLAGQDERHLLAQIVRQVVHQPAEAAEQLADRHQARAHGGVAQFQRQAFDLLGDRLHLPVRAGGGDLLQARLGNDQLADLVHQVVQPLGRHTNAAGDARRNVGMGGGGWPGVRRCSGFAVRRCNRSGLRRCNVGRCRRAIRYRFQIELHIVEHEQKDLLDRRTRLDGGQRHLPADVAFARVQRLERRDRPWCRRPRCRDPARATRPATATGWCPSPWRRVAAGSRAARWWRTDAAAR